LPVTPAKNTTNQNKKYKTSTLRVGVSINIPDIIKSATQKTICKIRVYHRDNILISSPQSMRGIAQRPIIRYDMIFFVSASSAKLKKEFSSSRFCT